GIRRRRAAGPGGVVLQVEPHRQLDAREAVGLLEGLVDPGRLLTLAHEVAVVAVVAGVVAGLGDIDRDPLPEAVDGSLERRHRGPGGEGAGRRRGSDRADGPAPGAGR